MWIVFDILVRSDTLVKLGDAPVAALGLPLRAGAREALAVGELIARIEPQGDVARLIKERLGADLGRILKCEPLSRGYRSPRSIHPQ
jgi:hypothetical protein